MRRDLSDTRNMTLALAIAMVILGLWTYFVEAPRKQAEAVAMRAKAKAEQLEKKRVEEEKILPPRSREARLANAPRVKILSSHIHGSFSLRGLRFDDLTLAKYRLTRDPSSPEVRLFSPAGDTESYFAEFGWLSSNTSIKLPSSDTLWSTSSDSLTPTSPVTLTWTNPDGIKFTVVLALDEKYLFTLTQSVVDASGTPLALQTYAYINRVYDKELHLATMGILHEGPLGVFDGTLKETSYHGLMDNETPELSYEAKSGWMGMSDKYWLSAVLPENGISFTSRFSYYKKRSHDHFHVEYIAPVQEKSTLRFFAGAKELDVLDGYAAQYQIPLFDRAVDFGMLYFLTKPIFLLLTWFHAVIGNFGVAILILTILVKLLMYPLANKSYHSMNQMKRLQPKMMEMRERFKDDKMRMNQEIIALYKREKVNPASGCLPLLLQMPVFFALYKVLYVSIEMRHAPFFGWIHDLSAPDPTNIFNLFGLLAWTPPGFLHIGVWPLLMCLSMIVQQRMTPPPPDPTQAMVLKLFPFIFVFLFAAFPAGLVIYWTWSNILSILQQWWLKRRYELTLAHKR